MKSNTTANNSKINKRINKPEMSPLDIFDSKYYETPEALLDAWMEEQGIVSNANIIEPPKTHIITQQTIEEERAREYASTFHGVPFNGVPFNEGETWADY